MQLPRIYEFMQAPKVIVTNRLHSSLPLPSNVRQIDGLQILRVVAVLLVAWLHISQESGIHPTVPTPMSGVFGVDIFFVISGFIICSVVLRSKKRAGPGAMWDFLQRRLIRIFPIYWFFATMSIVRLAFRHTLLANNYLPIFFLLPGYSYPEMNLLVDFTWTLVFEMFFYYSLAAVLLVSVRRAVPVALAFFCGAVVLGLLMDIHRPLWNILCNPILLEFVLGGGIALLYARLGARKKTGVVLTTLGVLTACVMSVHVPAGASGFQMIMANDGVWERVLTWGVAAGLIVGGVVFWSPSIRTPVGRIAVVLGNASYSTYLASALVIEWTLRQLARVFGSGEQISTVRFFVAQTVCIVAVFTTGWVCYQLVEWPMLRWLGARLATRQSDLSGAGLGPRKNESSAN